MSKYIALYLFLGGSGAGTFLVTLLVYCLYSRKSSLVSRKIDNSIAFRFVQTNAAKTFALAAIYLLLGCLCLFLDLGRPGKMFQLFLSPTVSYISVGAYAIAILLLLSFCFCCFIQRRPQRLPFGLRIVMCLIGIVLSCYIMLYTGLLLASIQAVPLWSNVWLPPLFVASSLCTGLASFALVTQIWNHNSHIRKLFETALLKADLLFIICEACLLIAFLLTAGNHPLGLESLLRLTQGDVSTWFLGGFVLCGILIPALCNVLLLRGLLKNQAVLFTSLMTLIGCVFLRYSIVTAGIHSLIA